MELKDIRQMVEIHATPLQVYEALMDSAIHSAFTGAEAVIDPVEGGKFTAYDNYIQGENIELQPGRKIVQKWRAVEEEWPEGHFSVVEFRLSPSIDGGTILEFIHRNLPASTADSFARGWMEFYWQPLKEHFGQEEDQDEFIY